MRTLNASLLLLAWMMKTTVTSNQATALHLLKFDQEVWSWFSPTVQPRTQHCWKIRRVQSVSPLLLHWGIKKAVTSNQMTALHLQKFFHQVRSLFLLWQPRTQRCWRIRRIQSVSPLLLHWRIKKAVTSNQMTALHLQKFFRQVWSWFDPTVQRRTQRCWKIRRFRLGKKIKNSITMCCLYLLLTSKSNPHDS